MHYFSWKSYYKKLFLEKLLEKTLWLANLTPSEAPAGGAHEPHDSSEKADEPPERTEGRTSRPRGGPRRLVPLGDHAVLRAVKVQKLCTTLVRVETLQLFRFLPQRSEA